MELDDLRSFFSADKYLTSTGVVIEDAGPGWCRCSLQAGPEHLNAGGAVQGGAIYTLADSAFAVACNYAHLAAADGRLTVSQSASISYSSPGRPGTVLYAEARQVSGGKRTCVFRIDVTDDQGKLIATMTGNGFTIDPA
ncbi:MAG: PaaI family thioesterase [Propionibacteriaceae bacterium]|jgi:acyl-CoA thioesterase|nr:PaaI family thioesterase [Propionibacteriaceae bacterium]